MTNTQSPTDRAYSLGVAAGQAGNPRDTAYNPELRALIRSTPIGATGTADLIREFRKGHAAGVDVLADILEAAEQIEATDVAGARDYAMGAGF